MAIRVAINHKSLYRYDRLVNLSPHVFRLRPAVHCRTPIEAYSLKIEPENHFINWQQDPFGNYQARVVFLEPTRALSIEVDLVADMTVINPFDFFLESNAEHYPFDYEAQLKEELTPFLEIKENGPLLTALLADIPRTQEKLIDFLVDINRSLSQKIKYTIRMEPGVQSCEETLEKQIGSCRDTGWLLVQILRHLGLAARFVSGYLVQLVADQKPVDGPTGPPQDFTDLHAWCEVYAPGAGWIGLDPTSGLLAGEGHIPLACVADPVSAAPVTGYTDPCETEFTYTNTVQRIHEDPRVTKPYTETQWADINALGQQVDADIIQHDIRLTMGGEPTFVSIDDTESPEWDTEADSRKKRALGAGLLRRLRDSFGPGGALYHGQGKWYPGEPLPRWKFGCFWRKDGVPVWKNDKLLTEPHKDYGFGVQEAERWTRHLTELLKITPDSMIPAYEDALFFLWTENRLPTNIDPLDFDFKEASERHRLAELLQTETLGEPIGYALPIRWNLAEEKWESCAWNFKNGRMFLIPGDSPIGLRLPLESMEWVPPEEREEVYERDPFEPREKHLDASVQTNSQSIPMPKDEEEETIFQTALCVEPRDGRLHIFMPPLTHLEHYLRLLEATEATAEALNMPVIIEGYEVPHDWRIQSLSVTPDPGVIEVNIHPAENWNELVHNTTTLYAQARLAGLSAEKFMLDGRHTGTGGGNHIIVGGRTPADSPLLRRPDLLRSLVTYWQHHPGLSYLFSSAFIGPTSQAPRVDEGRDEQLYELEVAFEQIPGAPPVTGKGEASNGEAEKTPPWLIDRLLRHLMVDLTGNTHRAEFCIDKLYSPDTASGRLGLLEMRAFEMPPHARMSIVQMLLIRTLIAKFWKTPYKGRLVRWGTELHDRFMLHHYVRADIQEVVSELQEAGYPFEMAWLDPFFEFRFPKLGVVNVRDIELELRMAIEPWHVLGEEVTRAGTSRFVDSSVERVQVKVRGLTDSRYIVTCNGRRLILHNTGTHGEYVGGVRYRAWQPPSALHPTIGIHSPLVFDIIDTWNGRAIGGCTYHVSHPGGRHYDTFPVNAYEAEGRRTSRFGADGHTPGVIQPQPSGTTTGYFLTEGTSPGPMAVPPEETNAEYPYTLDLRRTSSG
ncbi:MAG: transglutaminase family protein [Candidatus Poribacteria bacterium]|nr:transglutaminase family protein [Candidatus Poribacteria bacterium]